MVKAQGEERAGPEFIGGCPHHGDDRATIECSSRGEKPMSIKDRIRAMNLDGSVSCAATPSTNNNVTHNTKISSTSQPSSTESIKAANVVTLWRKRRNENNQSPSKDFDENLCGDSPMDASDSPESWTISDLISKDRKNNTQLKEEMKENNDPTEANRPSPKDADENPFNRSKLRPVNRGSTTQLPIINTEETNSDSDENFKMPQLRPVQSEEKGLDLEVDDGIVQSIEEPPRTESEASTNLNGENIDSLETKPVLRHGAVIKYNATRNKNFYQPSPVRVNWVSPPRSKISDRIKAFSSPAHGSNKWKQMSSPQLSTVPGRWGSGNSSASNGSSEKDSINNNDDDSFSVTTPKCIQNTPARLGAQPPTPNSYNSEAASSGDAAVNGSFDSRKKRQGQMQYEKFDTPDVSLNDDSSTCASSLHDDRSSKTGPASYAANSKNSLLQSKLESDKKRANRRSINQTKVPSVLVAAQKKAQGSLVLTQWGDRIVRKLPVIKGEDSPKVINSGKEDIENEEPLSSKQSQPKSPRKLLSTSPFIIYDREVSSPLPKENQNKVLRQLQGERRKDTMNCINSEILKENAALPEEFIKNKSTKVQMPDSQPTERLSHKKNFSKNTVIATDSRSSQKESEKKILWQNEKGLKNETPKSVIIETSKSKDIGGKCLLNDGVDENQSHNNQIPFEQRPKNKTFRDKSKVLRKLQEELEKETMNSEMLKDYTAGRCLPEEFVGRNKITIGEIADRQPTEKLSNFSNNNAISTDDSSGQKESAKKSLCQNKKCLIKDASKSASLATLEQKSNEGKGLLNGNVDKNKNNNSQIPVEQPLTKENLPSTAFMTDSSNQKRILRQMSGDKKQESPNYSSNKYLRKNPIVEKCFRVEEPSTQKFSITKQSKNHKQSVSINTEGGCDKNVVNTKFKKNSLQSDVMKKLMSKRRQRRKEIQAGKIESFEEIRSQTTAKQTINPKEKGTENLVKIKEGISSESISKKTKSSENDSQNFVEKTIEKMKEKKSEKALNSDEEADYLSATKGEQAKLAEENTNDIEPEIDMPPLIIRSTQKNGRSSSHLPKVEISPDVFCGTSKTSNLPQENYLTPNPRTELEESYPDDESQPECISGLLAIDLSPIKSDETCGILSPGCTSSRVSRVPDISSLMEINCDSPDINTEAVSEQITPKTANRNLLCKHTKPTFETDSDSYISEAVSVPVLSFGQLPSMKFFSDAHSEVLPITLQPSLSTNTRRNSKSDSRGGDIGLTSFVHKKQEVSLRRTESRNSKVSTDSRPNCDTHSNASSAVWSSALSTTSSASGITSLSSKANRLLAGRRGKMKRKQEQSCSTEKLLATNLARRMLSGENNGNEDQRLSDESNNKQEQILSDRYEGKHKEKLRDKNKEIQRDHNDENIIEKEKFENSVTHLTDRKFEKQEIIGKKHTVPQENGSSKVSTSIRSVNSIDMEIRRDPMHFNSHHSSFDDPDISIHKYLNIPSPVSIATSDDRSTIVTSEKNSPTETFKVASEGTQLMAWVSHKLTDMKIDKLASDISQKIDGANNAVSEISRVNFSCGDGVLDDSLNSTYSSAVRISQLDLDETSSDEEVAIEVEYIPKDVKVEPCDLLKPMKIELPKKTGESFFAVSPNASIYNDLDVMKLHGNNVSIPGTVRQVPSANMTPSETMSRYNRKY